MGKFPVGSLQLQYFRNSKNQIPIVDLYFKDVEFRDLGFYIHSGFVKG